MKKTIFLSAMLTVAISITTFANAEKKHPSTGDPKAAITSLTVNADVTIILVNNNQKEVSMSGDPVFMEHVSYIQNGKMLIIKASKNRSYKGKGTIYVPASNLEYIEVNSDADVRSAGILHTPNLKVKVNGHCKVHVLTTGKVTPESDSFRFNYYSRDLLQNEPLSSKK